MKGFHFMCGVCLSSVKRLALRKYHTCVSRQNVNTIHNALRTRICPVRCAPIRHSCVRFQPGLDGGAVNVTFHCVRAQAAHSRHATATAARGQTVTHTHTLHVMRCGALVNMFTGVRTLIHLLHAIRTIVRTFPHCRDI